MVYFSRSTVALLQSRFFFFSFFLSFMYIECRGLKTKSPPSKRIMCPGCRYIELIIWKYWSLNSKDTLFLYVHEGEDNIYSIVREKYYHWLAHIPWSKIFWTLLFSLTSMMVLSYSFVYTNYATSMKTQQCRYNTPTDIFQMVLLFSVHRPHSFEMDPNTFQVRRHGSSYYSLLEI